MKTTTTHKTGCGTGRILSMEWKPEQTVTGNRLLINRELLGGSPINEYVLLSTEESRELLKFLTMVLG